jgi:uncharacterized protein YegP (UPF0339 family)
MGDRNVFSRNDSPNREVTNVPEFSRRVSVEIFKDDPMTREQFVEWTAVDGAPADQVDEAYERYLHYHQPYRWHAKASNSRIVSDGESYFNEADCINTINLLFGDDTTMYWSRMYGEDRGLQLLRYGKADREHQAASTC